MLNKVLLIKSSW